jgi:hypothetical protein
MTGVYIDTFETANGQPVTGMRVSVPAGYTATVTGHRLEVRGPAGPVTITATTPTGRVLSYAVTLTDVPLAVASVLPPLHEALDNALRTAP